MKTTAIDPFVAEILDRIQFAMERKRLSLTAVAKASGIPRGTLARRFRNPGAFYPSEIERLAPALDVPLLFLFCGDEVGM